MIRDSSGQIEIVGHERVVATVDNMNLSNLLLVGPSSVGKRSILERKLESHKVTDVVRIYDLRDVDMTELRRLSQEAPRGVRAILLRVDRLSRAIEEKLLKIIEDAPEGVIFMAAATFLPSLALRTRFTYLRVNYLSSASVATLLNRLGYESSTAVDLAKAGLGTVNGSIYFGKTSQYVSLANRALKFIEEHDEEMLDSMYSKWEDGHTDAILTWATERLTGQWRLFQETDFPSLSKGTAMRILTRVDRYDRPRYVVRSALVSIVREDSR